MHECTEEDFLEDVDAHHMIIDIDSGVHRSILFKRNGDPDKWLRITTWPCNLCISSDMGCYVFERIDDMFEFFRDKEITPDYWAGKLIAVSTPEGCREYCGKKMRDALTQYFLNPDEFDSKEKYEKEKERFEDEVFPFLSDEFEAYETLNGDETISDSDFLIDLGSRDKKFTYHYIWCLYAIVWAIQQYDKHKASPLTGA